MSPDRTTITRAEALRRKREELKRQEAELSESSGQTPSRNQATRRTVSRFSNTSSVQESQPRVNRKNLESGSDKKPTTRNLPKISLPKMTLPKVDFSSITVALIIAALSIGLTYVALYTPVFSVQTVDVSGTKLIDPYAIINGLSVMGEPLLTLDRDQVRINILASYPEVKDVSVSPAFPNKLEVNIIERIPIAEWHQEGSVVWVDNEGFSFEPKSHTSTLPIVDALAPAPTPGASTENIYGAKPFIYPQLASAVQTVSRMLPQGTVITYTPEDGLSWIDPIGGWQVLYGKTDGNN